MEIPELVIQFNERFNRNLDPTAEYPRSALENMATVAQQYGEIGLANALLRRALTAREMV